VNSSLYSWLGKHSFNRTFTVNNGAVFWCVCVSSAEVTVGILRGHIIVSLLFVGIIRFLLSKEVVIALEWVCGSCVCYLLTTTGCKWAFSILLLINRTCISFIQLLSVARKFVRRFLWFAVYWVERSEMDRFSTQVLFSVYHYVGRWKSW